MKDEKNPLLFIKEEGEIVARGIWLSRPVAYLQDGDRTGAGYPDTGVFVLLEGSKMAEPPERLEKYVSNGLTTRDIVLQSRNLVAQLVLGKDKGGTNSWK